MALVQSKWLLTAIIFLTVFIGCESAPGDKDILSFRPLLNQPYQFSVIRSVTTTWTYQDSLYERSDTTIAAFTLKHITINDSSYSSTISFNEYKVKLPPFGFTMLNVDLSKPLVMDNTFSLFDSIGYYINGLSLNVDLSKKGMVEKVDGLPQMLTAIAAKSHRDYGSVRSLLQDHISVNAITDLLNRTFSSPPDKTVTPGFRWSNTITLITKAPIDIRTFYIPAQTNGDSLIINTSQLINSSDSSGVVKGNGKGIVLMSYATGLPYRSENTSETVTYMTENTRTEKEHLKIEQLF